MIELYHRDFNLLHKIQEMRARQIARQEAARRARREAARFNRDFCM